MHGRNCRVNGLTHVFDIAVLGEKETLSYGEANGLLPHPDRAQGNPRTARFTGYLAKMAKFSRLPFVAFATIGSAFLNGGNMLRPWSLA